MWGVFRFLDTQEEEKAPKPGRWLCHRGGVDCRRAAVASSKGLGVNAENGELVNLENREPEAEYRAPGSSGNVT